MDKVRHTILGTNILRRRVLIDAAKIAKVSVDELVQAGLNRPVYNRPAGKDGKTVAHRAAEALVKTVPSVFKGLDAWPWVCRFCAADVKAEALLSTCPECAKVGCPSCVQTLCPVCREAAAAHARKAAERAKLMGR